MKTETLFPLPESPSPRLLWLKEHKVSTHCNDLCEEPWCAFFGTFDDIASEDVLME